MLKCLLLKIIGICSFCGLITVDLNYHLGKEGNLGQSFPTLTISLVFSQNTGVICACFYLSRLYHIMQNAPLCLQLFQMHKRQWFSIRVARSARI